MIALTFILSLTATVAVALHSENVEIQKYMWESFKKDFNKNFESVDVDNKKFAIFLDNLKIIDARNAAELKAGGSAVHGVTKFSDLSQEEFASHYLKSDVSMRSTDRKTVTIAREPNMNAGLVDWSGKLTTPVKDQGYCGSCWAFSATEQIESDAIRTLGVTYLLSAEQVTQCTTAGFGCGGGWSEKAYSYVQRAGGIETESNYPYTSYYGVTGTCSATSSKFVVTVTGYQALTSESAMASYVQTTGPLSVCVDADNWNSYTGGVLSVCGTSVDHCVQATGVDTSSYWKVRNSWGTGWGESGFIRLAYGKNTCAITNDPTYATVALK